MKTEILTLLRETDGYVSGQELCEKFGVSRTAVWKAINQLKEAGYEIEAVQNKGYRLVSVPDILSESELQSVRKTRWIGEKIAFFDVVDSTNTRAKQLAEEGAPNGTYVIAERQDAGKGRRGRGFDSPAGQGIWMTLVLKPEIDPNHASMITLVTALAVSKAITDMTGRPAGIKWPNDIIMSGKKVCGILTEMSAQFDYVNHIVVGIGINVQNKSFPKDIESLGKPVISKYADYTELDRNHHVNNTRYAAWFCDAIHKFGLKPELIKEFTINYISEVKDSEKVDLYVSMSEDNKKVYVYGMKNDNEKVFVVEAIL